MCACAHIMQCVHPPSFVYHVFHYSSLCEDIGAEQSEASLERTLDIANVVHTLYARTCRFTWDNYLVAEQEEINAELAWACSRTLVKNRCQGSLPEGVQPIHDPAGSFLAALTIAERHRLEIYGLMKRGQACDVNQDPKARCITTRNGNMMTITKGIGLLFSKRHGRWFCPSELFTSMGFPCAVEHARAAGAECPFTRGKAPPATRSLRSQKNQCGNSMHVNVIGAYQSALLFVLPSLGCCACARLYSGSQFVPPISSGDDSDGLGTLGFNRAAFLATLAMLDKKRAASCGAGEGLAKSGRRL